MANYLVTDTELTNVANSIREKGGTTESLNWPNGYITAVEDITTGGDTYAVVVVTYPAGSVCIATNGTTTLTAANTSGQAAFSIPTPTSTPETWTISCSDSSTGDNDGITININSYGQYFIIELTYADPVLNNNSWETISTIAQRGAGDTYWDIGDRKTIILNGKIGTYLDLSNFETYVFILDFNHPINKYTADNNIIFGGFKTALTGGIDICLCDRGYNGTGSSQVSYFNINHVQIDTTVGNSNYGGWKGCDLRYDILGATQTPPDNYNSTSRNTSTAGYDATTAAITSPKASTLMSALPSDFRSVLRLWTRYVDNKGNASNVDANVTACIDAGISLLAEFEIFGSRSWANTYEKNHQKQMQYYTTGNSKVKYKHNATTTTAFWWTSSAMYYYAYSFCYVDSRGSCFSKETKTIIGLAPAFKV